MRVVDGQGVDVYRDKFNVLMDENGEATATSVWPISLEEVKAREGGVSR